MIGLPVIIFLCACVAYLFVGPIIATFGRYGLILAIAIAIGVRVMLP